MADQDSNDQGVALQVTPQDRDLMIRTVIGEAGNQPDLGKAAVANIIMNRTASGKWGNSPGNVVLAKSQFEPWATRSRELMSYAPNSPQYQAAARVVDGVLAGHIPDVTGGMTHFYSPSAQAALGRPAPSWGQGPGLQIGAHRFYAPEGALSVSFAPPVQPDQTATDDAAPVNQAVPASVPIPATEKATPAMPQTSTAPDAFDQLISGGDASSQTQSSSTPDAFDKLIGAVPTSQVRRAVPADAKPGPQGLMWNAVGGYDPHTGELVVGGKPMTDQTSGPLSTIRSAVIGFINGIPVVGPSLLDATEKGGAAIRSVKNDTKYSDELAQVQAGVNQDTDAHPIANTVGQVAGAVTGYVGLGASSLGARALGIEGPTMASRMLVGAGGNALLGGVDAAARGENPIVGAGVGGVGGALAPLAGKIVGNGVQAVSSGIQNMMPTGIPGISRSSANLVNKLINADGSDAVQNALIQHGDQTMLADAGPALRNGAGTLAALPETAPIIENPLLARQKGAADRISGQLDESLGPMGKGDDAQSVVSNIEVLRDKTTQPMYDAAHKNAPPVDIGDTLDLIDQKMKTATGATLTALKNARASLVESAVEPVVDEAGQPVMGTKNVRSALQVTPSKPVELRDFIKKMGGINDEGGDLKAMGLNKLHNSKGVSLDEARQRAAEAGYIGGNTDDAMANTFTSDLLDALGSDHPVYNVHDLHELNNTASGYGMGNRGGWTQDVGDALIQSKEVPVTNSEKIHNVRKDLDLALQGDTPALGVQPGALGTKNATIAQIRESLDKNLKTQVPGMKEADAAFAQLADRQNAVDRGYNKILGSNQSPHPDQFAVERGANDPGTNIAQNKGIRSRIDRMFGTGTQRDAVTLNKLLSGGEDGYAAQNLRTAFGEEPVNALVDTLNREKLYNETFNEVSRNSATARKTFGKELFDKTQPGSTFVGNMSGPGMVLQAGKSMIVDPLVKMIMESPDASRNLEIARILTAQGASRDEIFGKLLSLNTRQSAVGNVSNKLTGGASYLTNLLGSSAAVTHRPGLPASR